MKLMKKLLGLSLVALAVVGLTACVQDETPAASYTYNAYSTALGNNWNPHAWETSADSSMLDYISSPFVDMSIKDSVNGEYQWVYEMATEVVDVTAQHQSDLVKYGSTLPSGKTATDVTEGYVYQIKLNPNAKWENGEAIDADDYVRSMELFLDSRMRNYRANLYYAGESAIAGAAAFYNSEAPIYENYVVYDGDTPVVNEAETTYVNFDRADMTIISGYSLKQLKDDYGYIRDAYDEEGNQTLFGATYYKELAAEANAYGYIAVTEENKAKLVYVFDQFLSAFNASIYDAEGNVKEDWFIEFLFYQNGVGEKVEYSSVGLYKVDQYTINYVLQTYQDINYFLTSLTSTWLVYEPLYTAGFDTTGELLSTNYGTSKETTMSYGAYKMESLQNDKQVVYVQNENWYGYEKQEDGSLVSYTNFLVDGEKRRQYMTTKVVIDVMTEDAAKLAFQRGQLDDWTPAASELSSYAMSDQLYQVTETYTMSFFFNTNLNDLMEMDNSKGNTNSVVLSNHSFRKAFSLAINRTEWVTTTAGYVPAYSLLNDLYHYDIYNDPSSSYRRSDEAMKAIVDLYGITYGEGTNYATLEEAYKSVTGYNLAEAKSLMAQAYAELTEAGIYEGGEIVIRIGYAKGALTSDDQAQVALMNQYLNAAVEGSGFGSVTLEAVGNLPDRYGDVPAGNYAIGYGAWGGAAFYPFRNFQVYMDTVQYAGQINELACWDPTTEEFTINVNGVDETMTYQEWSRSMMGTGKFAEASNETKLAITAALEKQFLSFYYRIPLASSAACFLLSYQIGYYTENYNIMYGFGGMRLMHYNYTDAEWAAEVAANGGTVNYK